MAKPRQKAPLKGRDQQQAERLGRLRIALGYGTQAAFAKFLEIEYPRWNNFESGLPLSKDVAFQIVRKIPGMTTDYLFFGKPDGLPFTLARQIGAIEAE